MNIFFGLLMLSFQFGLWLLTKPTAQRKELLTASEIRMKFPVRRSTPILPPSSHPSRLCICLDLDETCVFVARHATEELARERLMGTCETHLIRMPGKEDTVLEVIMRPDVRTFLEHITAMAEVVVFTASRSQYAEAICTLLDPFNVHFQAILCRDHALAAERHVFVKDLSGLGRDLRRTILVDNSAYGFILQPENGVPVSSFRGEPSDSHLLKVVLPVIYSLLEVDDVRPVLDKTFQMREWFQKKGLIARDDVVYESPELNPYGVRPSAPAAAPPPPSILQQPAKDAAEKDAAWEMTGDAEASDSEAPEEAADNAESAESSIAESSRE